MSNARSRVKDELTNLVERIEKLENLLNKIKTGFPCHEKLASSISNEHKKLLRKQLKVMKQYKRILEKRLSIWIEEN